jgi:hypothetical protein
METPRRDSAMLQLVYLLAKSSASLVPMARGWCLSYARAGMPKGLCEYAVARDIVEGLASLERGPSIVKAKGEA